jgi:hypothetical protein
MPSDLPIITPPPEPRRSTAERYGSLFWLGLAGIVVLLGILAWFAWGVWSLRRTFREIYVLHDASRSEPDRIQAAYALSRDPRATDRQRWDIAFRKPLPPLARYLVAESLSAEAISGDPRGYVLAVARSEGWPEWLRLLIARPLAYAAAQGTRLPRDLVREIARADDPCLRLWTAFTLAALGDDAPEARPLLERTAAADDPNRELAGLLLEALDARPTRRDAILNRATLWLRSHHPESAKLWEGWKDVDGRLVRRDQPAGAPLDVP